MDTIKKLFDNSKTFITSLSTEQIMRGVAGILMLIGGGAIMLSATGTDEMIDISDDVEVVDLPEDTVDVLEDIVE